MGSMGNKMGDTMRAPASDLVFLLERGYPKKSSVQLVGNRYALPSEQRRMLLRGVFRPGVCRTRSGKLVDPLRETPPLLLVDGYNILITIESYLLGRTVFTSMDGYVRDVAGVFGSYRFSDMTLRSTALAWEILDRINTRVAWYLDAPASRSGELAAHLRKQSRGKPYPVSITVADDPDRCIIERGVEGAAATSDTVIIDRVTQCVDIPAVVIGTLGGSVHADLREVQGF